MAKQIAVWGTPDSGKSVLATKLALELTEMGKRVAVVYTDDRAPVLPMLFPGTRAAREYSVGAVLERVLMTPDDVLRQANLCRHHRELALFGYAAGENRQSYPAVLSEKATELYGILNRLADVLIVDCSAALYDSPLSDVAVRTADRTLYLLTPEPKALQYRLSQMPLYPKVAVQNVLVSVYGDVRAAERETVQACVGVLANVPYSQAIRQQSADGTLLSPIRDRGFQRAVRKLAEWVL